MDRNDDDKFAGIVRDYRQREKEYREMTKDELVNLLVMKDMLDDSLEPGEDGTELWYFVADWTEAKYLTSDRPTMQVGYGRPVWTTDGEVNIRVPVCMEPILPAIKYGDEPVKIRLTVSY